MSKWTKRKPAPSLTRRNTWQLGEFVDLTEWNEEGNSRFQATCNIVKFAGEYDEALDKLVGALQDALVLLTKETEPPPY